MNTLTVKILTPESKVEYNDITSVILPGFDGQYCIQYNHIPMALTILEGEIVARQGDITHKCIIRGKGFAEINRNKIVVFIDGIISFD